MGKRIKNTQKLLKYLSVFFVFILLTQGCFAFEKETCVHNGVLDLRTFDFKEKPIISLYGYWKFYPNQFVDDSLPPKEEPILVRSDQHWNSYFPGLPGEQKSIGYGTYQLQIFLPEDFDPDDFVLVSGAIVSASKYIIEDKTVIAIGKLGLNENEEQISYEQVSVPFPNVSGKINLFIQTSNFHHARGGLWVSPKIGKNLETSLWQNRALLYDAALFGGLLILSLYQISFYLFRKKLDSIIYFVGICLAMACKISSENSGILAIILPDINGNFALRFEYISIALVMWSAVLYMNSLFPHSYPNFLNYGIGFIYSLPILLGLFGPMYHLSIVIRWILIFSFFPILLSIYVCYQIFKAKLASRELLVVGLIILASFATFDISVTIFSLSFPHLFGIGFLGFVFTHTVYLTQKQTKSIRTTELELLATQYLLVQTEKMSHLGVIVAGVAHEINSPISIIRLGESNIRYAMENLVQKFEIVFLEKSKEELDFLSEILNHPSDTKHTFASSKEMKIIISKIQEELHGLGADQGISENVADLLFSCGIISPPKHWIEYLKNPKNRELLEWAAEWRGVMVKLTGIHDASERVSKIVQSLKTYTHMDPNAEKKKTDIRDSIETVLTIFQHSFKMGIQVKREFEPIPQIDCYPDELIQVWSNLTQNALQAMQGKGNLLIYVNSIEISGKKWIRVCFSDTGPGISEKDQKKIFQAFFSTKLAGEGTGLGLYISRQIVEKHDGKIWFETSRSGTKFFVDLPS